MKNSALLGFKSDKILIDIVIFFYLFFDRIESFRMKVIYFHFFYSHVIFFFFFTE